MLLALRGQKVEGSISVKNEYHLSDINKRINIFISPKEGKVEWGVCWLSESSVNIFQGLAVKKIVKMNL